MEIIMKITVLCVLSAVILLLFARCDDSLEIKQAYPFKLSTWYLQKSIRNGEAVEIRFTLERSGVYDDAKYYIGYIQTGGKGEVFDLNDTLLINRELHALDDMAGIDKENPVKQVFTLFYRSLSDKQSELKFIVCDNFGQQTELTVSFEPEQS